MKAPLLIDIPSQDFLLIILTAGLALIIPSKASLAYINCGQNSIVFSGCCLFNFSSWFNLIISYK